jgi:hypothetical protein
MHTNCFDFAMCFEFGFLWQNVLQHAYTLKEFFYIPTIFAITILIVPHDNRSITIGYSCTFNYIKIAIIVVWFFLSKITFDPNFDIVKLNWRRSRWGLNLVFSNFKFFGFNFNTFFQIQKPPSLFKNRSNSMYTLHTLEIVMYKSSPQIKTKVYVGTQLNK